MGTADLFMTESDAVSWYMEEDPGLRSTVVAVAWLEQAPPWDELSRRLEAATRLVPSFRRRPLEARGRLAPPRWATDPGFDLSWHLRRVAAPEPRSRETVLEVARLAATTGFDRTRPLWEFTLVEGLADGGAALVMKFHHALTDGIGGVRLAYYLVDDDPSGRVPAAMPVAPPGEVLGAPALVLGALANRAGELAGRTAKALRWAPRTGRLLLRHPLGTASSMAGTVRSVARTVAPVRRTLSPVMVRRGPGRRLHALDVPLEELHRAAATAGGTVNDAFMAAVTGGLRRYHERHGVVLDDLMVTMPISLRRPTDPPGGNRITLMRFVVPAGIVDPVARIGALDSSCRGARAEPSLALTEEIAGALNLLPAPVVGSMLKHVDFLASDVPGFPAPVYLCGSRVTGYYPFGPTIGAALNATLFSYDGGCCIGVTVDTEAVPDDDVLMECLAEGVAEVSAAGRQAGGAGRKPTEENKEGVPC